MRGIPGRGDSVLYTRWPASTELKHKDPWRKKGRLELNQGAEGCDMKDLNKRMKGTTLVFRGNSSGRIRRGRLGDNPLTLPFIHLGDTPPRHGNVCFNRNLTVQRPTCPYLHERQTKNCAEGFGRIMDKHNAKTHMLQTLGNVEWSIRVFFLKAEMSSQERKREMKGRKI